MAFDTDSNLDAMPEDVRREYVSILRRFDANFIRSPDPVYSKEWVNDALAMLNRPPAYFGGLVGEDQIAVRNTILACNINEAFADRRQDHPSEDEKTSWHLAVKRGVEGYLRYDAAKTADLDRDKADAWGSIGQHFFESLGAGREDIFTSEDWVRFKKQDRENSSANFERNSMEEASRAARAPKATPAVPDEAAIRATGIERQRAMRQDPMEIIGLAHLQQKLEKSRPSDKVFERFRAMANIEDSATWDSLTPEQRWAFSVVASADIYAEQLSIHEMAAAARPEGTSDADFFTARRERAAADAESYYATGLRPQVAAVTEPSERDPFADPKVGTSLKAAHGDGGTTASSDAAKAPGKAVPLWMAVYENAIAEAGKSGTFQSESDAVRARLANPQSEADRFLASAMNAKTKGGEALDFNTVTWKGRNQQSAAYGAFWLSHGLLKEAASTGIGTPPRQVAVEAIFASPELQYQAARAHVEKLLATKLANGKNLAELPPPERAAALAAAYRFGVERVSESYARGKGSRASRGDHWTAAVATPLASEFARTPAPTEPGPLPKSEVPVTVAASETLSVPVPTIKDADSYRDAVKRRAEAEGVALSDSQIADRARLEALYRSVLSKVAGVTDPKVVAELEKRVPALRRITDGSVSMTAIEMMLAKDGQIVLDPSTRATLARQLGLEADPKTGKSPDLVDVLRGKAAEAVEAVKASEGKGANQAAEVPTTAPPSATVETKASPATVLAKVISDLKRDAASTGKNSAYNLEIAGALEQWFSQPAIGSRAAEIAEELGKLSGPALLDRAVNLATSAEPPAGASEFVRFTDMLEKLTESKAPKAAKGNELTGDGVSVNTSLNRAARSELSLGV